MSMEATVQYSVIEVRHSAGVLINSEERFLEQEHQERRNAAQWVSL